MRYEKCESGVNWPFRDYEETESVLCRIALWDCFGQ